MNEYVLSRLQLKLNRISENQKRVPLPPGVKTASVLVPLAVRDEELVVLFTHRSYHLNSHSGQVSFPGGMQEDWDSDAAATALRETEEEIGIKPGKIEILGRMKFLQSHTGLVIYPFVGFIQDLNGLQKNLDEVESIFCIPYTWLSSPKNLYQEDFRRPGGEIHKVWTFREYEGEKIWGITAEITRQLFTL
jgi:8-oxo-dGTP pyrophosphatase MutT (NUDIX family)